MILNMSGLYNNKTIHAVTHIRCGAWVKIIDSLNYIKKADHLLKLSIPLERDDGTYQVVTAYRSKHKNYRSPTRGGIRLSENCDIQ